MAISGADKITVATVTDSNDDPTITATIGTDTTDRIVGVLLRMIGPAGYASGLAIGASAMTEETSARATVTSAGVDFRSQFFWLNDETETSSTDFDLTVTGATDSVYSIAIYEFTEAGVDNPIGAIQTNEVTEDTDSTFSITTQTAGSYLLCGLAGIAHPGSPASGLTEDQDDNEQGGLLVWAGSRTTTAAGSYSVGATTTDLSTLDCGAANAIEILPDTVNVLSAGGVSSTPTVGTPGIGQVHTLAATGISVASSVDAPSIDAVELSANSIMSAPSVGTPDLGVIRNLVANSVITASSVGVPTIGQAHGLVANSVASAASVGVPDIGQKHVLTAPGLVSAPSVGTPTLADFIELAATSVIAASSVGVPAIGQIHALAAGNVVSVPLVGNPAMTQDHQLLADGITATITVGAPVFSLLGVWFGVDPESESWTVTTPGSEGWTDLTPGSETWTAEE